jgi:carbonic anhydrase/acetyltransferase-like protein (isoleucine patch superfamily)
MNYRKLTDTEIIELEKQNCLADDWEKINVVENFNLSKIKNTQFSGTVYLESFENTIKFNKVISKESGIYDSFIHNCRIGSNSLIKNVKMLANYRIGENVIIENVNNLTVSESTAFGNGTKIEILNEGGGRELKIFDKLTAQTAYLIVTRRDNTKFIKNTESMILEYVESITSNEGYIGNDSTIFNCNYINNVKCGNYSNINGALHLENGTLCSNNDAPVNIGEGVIAKSFIILSGSTVDGASIIDKTFIGQGVRIGKQYSVENSAFFANSEGFHGEACSVFAGPYTVTHHKSTLLIAGLFSFYNAGSGSNQSNHLYKLGPVHQGILERGAKTGSFSYLMWPCRVGAFTGIIGKHYSNFDATNFPFSYILESNGKSLLMPAMNLCTVGTRRDSAKWPNRDRRKDTKKLDLIHFQLFNPYIIGKMLKGIEQLESLMIIEGNQEMVEFEGLHIKKMKINEAIEKYKMAIDIYIGDEIIKRLSELKTEINFNEIFKILVPENFKIHTNSNLDNWNDISGLYTPASSIENLITLIQNSKVDKLDGFDSELNLIFNNYDNLSYVWCLKLTAKIYNKEFKEFTPDDFIKMINNWKEKKILFNTLILKDAEKEFNKKSQIGFGIDGDSKVKIKDFREVRGTFVQNSFVKEIQSESDQINKITIELLRKFKNIN